MRLFDIARRHRRGPHSRGQSLVELALILPVLMLLVAADHQRPFEALVTRHQAVVLAFATRFLGDRGQARGRVAVTQFPPIRERPPG